jgi:hypothetical protein
VANELTTTPESFKKIIIPPTELPLIRFTTIFSSQFLEQEIDKLYYDFRYRIVSEDKSRTSAWSPIERIEMIETGSGKNSQGVAYFPYTTNNRIQVSTSGTPVTVTAVWNKPTIQSEFESIFNKINVYDVWVRWSTQANANESSTWTPWKYVTTTSSNNFSIIKENQRHQTIEIAIQLSSDTKIRDYRNNKVTLYRIFAPSILDTSSGGEQVLISSESLVAKTDTRIRLSTQSGLRERISANSSTRALI